MQPVFRSVLIKVSGEMLGGENSQGIDRESLDLFAAEIRKVALLEVRTAVIIGGGNIYRGLKGAAEGMNRASGDLMGMLATVINALALQDALERVGCQTRVMSAIEMQKVAEPYIRRRAMRHLDKGRVVIFAGGTGNPYFTTDTAAALRAAEVHSDVIFKATKVDGVYDKDPMVHSDAVKFDRLTTMDALSRGLKVMDATALSLCMENGIPIRVFELKPDHLVQATCGAEIGTLVAPEP
jgi:uridylate kinase